MREHSQPLIGDTAGIQDKPNHSKLFIEKADRSHKEKILHDSNEMTRLS